MRRRCKLLKGVRSTKCTLEQRTKIFWEVSSAYNRTAAETVTVGDAIEALTTISSINPSRPLYGRCVNLLSNIIEGNNNEAAKA